MFLAHTTESSSTRSTKQGGFKKRKRAPTPDANENEVALLHTGAANKRIKTSECSSSRRQSSEFNFFSTTTHLRVQILVRMVGRRRCTPTGPLSLSRYLGAHLETPTCSVRQQISLLRFFSKLFTHFPGGLMGGLVFKNHSSGKQDN